MNFWLMEVLFGGVSSVIIMDIPSILKNSWNRVGKRPLCHRCVNFRGWKR